MLMIWSVRCTFHTRVKSEPEFLSGLGLISGRASLGSHSPEDRDWKSSLAPPGHCLVGVVYWVLGGIKPPWGRREGP